MRGRSTSSPGAWVNGGFHVKLTTGERVAGDRAGDGERAAARALLERRRRSSGRSRCRCRRSFTIPAGSTSVRADERPEEHPRLDGRRAGAGALRRERAHVQHDGRDARRERCSRARTRARSPSSSTTACRWRRASRTRTARSTAPTPVRRSGARPRRSEAQARPGSLGSPAAQSSTRRRLDASSRPQR